MQFFVGDAAFDFSERGVISRLFHFHIVGIKDSLIFRGLLSGTIWKRGNRRFRVDSLVISAAESRRLMIVGDGLAACLEAKQTELYGQVTDAN